MAPLNAEQLHQIRDERIEQIIRSALKIFSRKGIIGAKMSLIASDAGISHGLLYHYFKSKDELFVSLIRLALEETRLSIENVQTLTGTPLEKIRILTNFILHNNGRHYFMLIHQVQKTDKIPEKAKPIVEQYSLQSFIDLLIPLFMDGQKKGEIVAGNPQELISNYLSILSGLILLDIKEDRVYRMPDVDVLMRILSNRK